MDENHLVQGLHGQRLGYKFSIPRESAPAAPLGGSPAGRGGGARRSRIDVGDIEVGLGH